MTTAQPKVVGGRYELTAPISSGGMGQVWRGYDTVLDRDIAVKLIRPDLARDDDNRAELVSRFRREARVTAKIDHPGVPAIHDAAFDVDTERLYLVMQLVHGVSLASVLAEHGAQPVDWVTSLAAQICTVLSYAHAVPVVHRDLKPGNIMITGDGSVKVLDFGVAAMLRSDVTRLTSTGDIVGTKPYMSPEQMQNAAPNPRSDLYALGCLLHELLCGIRVFTAAEDVALMYQHLEDEPTPLRALRADAPEALERLVLDLLAKRPDERPAGASEVYERLRPFLPPPGRFNEETEPDPRRPYQLPVAPRPRAAKPAEPQETKCARKPLAQADIDAAYEQAVELIDAQRGTQAAQALDEVIPRVVEDDQARDLRGVRAAALFLAGDCRRALPEFDSLALAYSRAFGRDDEQALDCRRQAAYCRRELGDLAEALAELRTVLLGYHRRGQEREPEILELRRTIARLQIATRQVQQAADALPALYDDVRAVLGPHDPLAHEIREMLERVGTPAQSSRLPKSSR